MCALSPSAAKPLEVSKGKTFSEVSSYCFRQREQSDRLQMSNGRPVGSPHGVLEKLGQDVIQRQRNEGETSCHVAVDPHSGRVAVLVFAQASGGEKGNSEEQNMRLCFVHKLYSC